MGSKVIFRKADVFSELAPKNTYEMICKSTIAKKRMLLIQEKMENAYPLKVILKVDIQKGSNWRQAH